VPSGEAAASSDSFTQAASDSLFVLVLGAVADYDPALPPGQLLSKFSKLAFNFIENDSV